MIRNQGALDHHPATVQDEVGALCRGLAVLTDDNAGVLKVDVEVTEHSGRQAVQ